MELTKVYESETGEKALYRKGSSDYHTLKYVLWLEARASQPTIQVDRQRQGNCKCKWGDFDLSKYCRKCGGSSPKEKKDDN